MFNFFSPYIDSEVNQNRHFIKIPFINKGMAFIDLHSIFKDKDHWRFGPYTPIFLIHRTMLLSFCFVTCSISAIGESIGKSQLSEYFQNFYALESYGG